jgi:Concanavalin A-like lectin/glucanases superfamily
MNPANVAAVYNFEGAIEPAISRLFIAAGIIGYTSQGKINADGSINPKLDLQKDRPRTETVLTKGAGKLQWHLVNDTDPYESIRETMWQGSVEVALITAADPVVHFLYLAMVRNICAGIPIAVNGITLLLHVIHAPVREAGESHQYDQENGLYITRLNYNIDFSIHADGWALLESPPATPTGYTTNLFAYYKMNDTSGGLLDSQGAHNFSYVNPGDGSVEADYQTPGIIAGAFIFGTGATGLGAVPSTSFRYPNSGNSQDFNWSDTTSFTIRFWVKTSQTQGFNRNIITPADNWTVNFGSAASGRLPDAGDGKINFEIAGNSATFDLDSNQDVSDGAWHLVTCWFDHSAGIAGLQIDTHPPVTLSGVDMQNDSSSPTHGLIGNPTLAGSWSHPLLLTEFAVWKDYVLTNADKTNDWNGGAGITFPLS